MLNFIQSQIKLENTAPGPLYDEMQVRWINGFQSALSNGSSRINAAGDFPITFPVVPDLAYLSQCSPPQKLEIALQKILAVAIVENTPLRDVLSMYRRLRLIICWCLPYLLECAIQVPITTSNLQKHNDIRRSSLFIINRLKELTKSMVSLMYTDGDSRQEPIQIVPPSHSNVWSVLFVQGSFLSVVCTPSAGEPSQLKQLES
ncbi:hypothetical protein AMATHDRAFT_7187 [Amanita thiersii Skay4041]|uniref:Uncharacterized protein n=1 Tax=Amanita thiersii Skay4041 TaxID=703135 RepID=A0A2A9NH76_9AGAR|nr:hypothetical protein AMATHDRAFT_7187 [Amanita thiersii Skay4041]